MKIYSILLISVFLFTGCLDKNCPEPIIEYKTIEVKVPTKTKRPKIDCRLNTEDDLLDCIILQKRVIEELTE